MPLVRHLGKFEPRFTYLGSRNLPMKLYNNLKDQEEKINQSKFVLLLEHYPELAC